MWESETSVNSMLGEIVSLPKSNGWVIVTSRQEGATLWSDMASAQKLTLYPLAKAQAMEALLRCKEEHMNGKVSNTEIELYLYSLQSENPDEFQALQELSGSEHPHGLRGLPLALAQAGRFINRRKMSFLKYVELYTKKLNTVDLPRLFLDVEDSAFHLKHQRTIWMTCKINLE